MGSLTSLRSRLAAALTRRVLAWEPQRWAVWGYRLALALEPNSPTRHRALADLYVKRQQWTLAIDGYRRALDRDRQDSTTWLKLAGLLDRHRGAEAAVECYLEAVRCDPTRQWCYDRKLWDVAEVAQSLPRFANYFQNLLDRDGEAMRYRDRADLRLNLGEALTRSGRIDAATQVFRAATTDRLIQRDRRFLSQLRNPNGDRQPDFIIIGAPKCGTTSLFYYLLQHPNVLPSLRKEIRFWSDVPNYGLDWYLSQLPPHPSQGLWLSGESSPAYFFTPAAPERIARGLPEVKLVALLRDPVDRVISQFYHAQRQGVETRSLTEFVGDLLVGFSEETQISELGALSAGFYAHHLRNWLQHFDRDQLLVLQSEPFFREPERVLGEVYDFLGLPDVPLQSDRVYNAGTYPTTEADVREKLAAFFAPYNSELEALLDRRFDW